MTTLQRSDDLELRDSLTVCSFGRFVGFVDIRNTYSNTQTYTLN